MPAQLDACINSLLGKWKAKPDSRPAAQEGQNARSQATAICTASLKKAGEMEEVYLEGSGPTILGAGATNRPHIKGLPAVSYVGEEKKLLRIPLLILGKWRHPRGVLDFTHKFVQKMLSNFSAGIVGHDLSWDNRHKPELGALAWFTKFEEEEEGGKSLLVGYAAPTPQGNQVVEERRYRYASIEFHPDWESPLVEALSSDDLKPYVEEGEAIMPEDVVTTVEDERVVALEAELAEQKAAYQKAVELAEKNQGAMEDRLVQLEAQNMRQFVSNILLQAEQHRDEHGRAHSKPLMDWARSVLLEEPVGEEGVIKLEDREDVVKTRVYFRKAIAHLLEVLPGAVPMTPAETEPDQKRRLEDAGGQELTDEDVQEFWGA